MGLSWAHSRPLGRRKRRALSVKFQQFGVTLTGIGQSSVAKSNLPTGKQQDPPAEHREPQSVWCKHP